MGCGHCEAQLLPLGNPSKPDFCLFDKEKEDDGGKRSIQIMHGLGKRAFRKKKERAV